MDEAEQSGWEIDLLVDVRSVQVAVPSGRILWFRPHDRFELIYGKNGTGKSNMLKGLSTLWCKDPTGRPRYRSRAFICLPPTPLITIIDSLHGLASIQERGSSEVGYEPVRRDVWKISDWNSIRPDGGFEYWHHARGGGDKEQMNHAIEFLAERSGVDFSREESRNDDPPLEELSDDDRLNRVLSIVMQAVAKRSAHDDVSQFRRNGGWIHDVLLPSVRMEIGKQISSRRLTNDSVRDVFERHGISFPAGVGDLDLSDPQSLSWQELITVYLAEAIRGIEVSLRLIEPEYLEGFAEEYCTGKDSEGVPTLDESKIIRLFIGPLLESTQTFGQSSLWIERDWGNEPTRWRIGLAAPIRDGSSSMQDLASAFLDSRHPVHELLSTSDSPFFAETSNTDVESSARENWNGFGGDFFRDAMGRPDPDGDFFAFTGYAFQPLGFLDSSPIPLVDLDSPINLEDFTKSVTKSAARGNGLQKSMVLLSSLAHESEIELPGLERIDELLAEMVRQVRGLDLGLTECRLVISRNMNRWVEGEPASLQFRTTSTGSSWTAFESLSSAQKYWVSAILKLMHAEHLGRPFLVIADEPERGIHERAVSAVFKKFGELGVPAVVATHSTGAFRQRLGAIRHLEVNNGEAHLIDVGSVSDVADAAERFGVRPLDLLMTRRTMVVVEGVHDRAVIEELVARSPDRTLSDRVLIASMSGVANIASIADAHLLTEFTDLNVLAVSDNASLATLSMLRDDAVSLLRAGVPASEIIRRIGIDDAERDTTQEQRFMFALLKRAIHRNVLDRVRFHPIKARDVQEAIPHSAFGLTDDWDQLRAEHDRSGSRSQFKKWLADEKATPITASTIRKAMRSLATLPEELSGLLTELEITVSISGAFDDDVDPAR